MKIMKTRYNGEIINFVKHFINSFDKLELKKLIVSNYPIHIIPVEFIYDMLK